MLVWRRSKATVFCGGSIVKANAVLTAGHCLKSAARALVIMGAHDLIANETGVERQLVNASSFKIHPQFNLQRAQIDIGLIILPTPVIFTTTIAPVKLPWGFLLGETFSGEYGTVTGYGKYCDDCGSSSVLRFTQNLILSNDECSQWFTYAPTPTETQVCMRTKTDSGNAGSCRGDSGGPLTVVRNDTIIQVRN